MNRTLTIILTCAAALLLSGIAGPAEANAKFKKPVSAAHAKKLQQRSIKRKARNLKNLTKRIDGMVALVKDQQQRTGTDLMADNQVKARLHELARQQGNLKRELAALKKQSVEQYAASRGIPLIPAQPSGTPPPPAGSPPPLPPPLSAGPAPTGG